VLPRIKELAGGNEFPMQHPTATDVYAGCYASTLIGAANRTVLILVSGTLGDFILVYHGHRMGKGLMSRAYSCEALTAHSHASIVEIVKIPEVSLVILRHGVAIACDAVGSCRMRNRAGL
jgi:hypothetical protein